MSRCKRLPGGLDLAVSTLVRIDLPILDAHRKKRIVYRVSMKEESPKRFFVAGGTQQIKRLFEKDSKDQAIELTVSTKPIPPVNSRLVKTDDKFLAPTSFLQSRDPAVVEHAVLLAAMLRAKKIPSHVAAGLVYVESMNSFGGHMWTEAFLAGEWIPLDATLGKGGIGPAHLKMADSPLDEDAPLPVSTFLPAYQAFGKLKIAVLKAE